jgi:hypothetical protein
VLKANNDISIADSGEAVGDGNGCPAHPSLQSQDMIHFVVEVNITTWEDHDLKLEQIFKALTLW